MSEPNENKDDLLELIDSLDINDDLNRKMDLFTQRKRKWDIQREKKSVKGETPTVFYDNGDTIKTVVRSNPQSAGSGTKTIVFETPGDTKNAGGGTVVIGEKEIQSFIEEEKVVSTQSAPEEQETSSSNKKVVYIIFTVLLGVLLCFGVYRFVSGIFSQNDTTSEQTDEYYTEIKTWAENYDTLTDSEKAQIVDLEAKFNKLDDEKKEEINSILKDKTGFTFDELLADAKSGEQTSKKNNNTELAEQKASLKSQISDIEKQLSQAETDLNTANDELNSAQADFDSWTVAVDSSGSALSAAKNAYDSAESTYNDPERESGDEEAYTAYKNALEAFNSAQTQYDSDYANYTSSYATLQEKQVNAQNAQSTYDSLYAQYSELKAQLDALDS